jgi:hypothetical protein
MYRWLRKSLFGLVLCAFVSKGAAAGELASRLTAAAGADTLAVIRAENLDATLKKADRFGQIFSAQISAMFPLVAPMIVGQIDLTRPITVVVASPKKYAAGVPVSAAMVCTARDANALIAALGAAGTAADGITPLKSTSGTEEFAAADGQDVIVSSSRDLVAAALKASPVPEARPGVHGDLTAHVPVAHVLALYADEIAQAKQKALDSLQNAPNQSGMSPEGLKALMTLYLEWAQSLGSQVEDLGIGLEMDGGELVLHHRLQPVAGSKLEAFFRAQTPPAENLLANLPTDAAIRMGASLRFTPELIDAYVSALDSLMSLAHNASPQATPIPLPDFNEVRPKIQSFLQMLGPRIAVAVLSPDPAKPGMRMIEYVDSSKPQEFGAKTEEMFNLWSPGLSALYARLGMVAEMHVGRVDQPDMPAGTYEMSFKFPGLNEQQKEAFMKLYGTPGIQIFMAPVEHGVVVAFGQDSSALLSQAAQAFKAPAGPAAAELPKLPGALVAAMVFDLPQYMKMVFGFMPPEQREKAQGELNEFFQTPQTMVMAASVEGTVVHAQCRYPLEATLKAVKAVSDAKKRAAMQPTP